MIKKFESFKEINSDLELDNKDFEYLLFKDN